MEIAAEMYIIIIGLVALAIMFSILFQFYPLFQGSEIIAEPDVIAKELAKRAHECWSQHRSGLDRASEVCDSLDIKTSSVIKEALFTDYLDCEKLPNSRCDNAPCGCTSSLYTNQEKVRWLVENSNTTIKISYDGNRQQISILDVKASGCFNGIMDGDEEGIDCGGRCAPCTSLLSECQANETYDKCVSYDKKKAQACCAEHQLCCSAVTTTTTTTSSTTTTTIRSLLCAPSEIAKRVDENLMMNHMDYLTAEPRFYGGSRAFDVADYISNELGSYGLKDVHFEDFSPFPFVNCNQNGRNVIGDLGPDNTPIIVIGGHRDSVRDFQCSGWPCLAAVDNGGGTANVMAIAKALGSCESELKNKIRFILFDGEESFLCGSIAYVNAHQSENIIRMINHDCEGYDASRRVDVYRTAGDLGTAANECCTELGIPCQLRGAYNGPGTSDHESFQQIGASYMFVGTFVPSCGHFHTSNDIMSDVSSSTLGWSAKITSCVIGKLYMK